MKIETAVIIPNYNGIIHLYECLESLKKQNYKKFKIILVDDGSTDESVSFVKKIFLKVDVIKLKSNKGFTKAINIGIAYTLEKDHPKYIALLNNDTKVDKKWLSSLIKSIKSDEKIAAVASNMFFYDNPEVINSQGVMGNFIGVYEDININKKLNEIKEINKKILAPCFGATLINVDLLKIIGLPDEDYFSYFEDVDWGIRANLLGYNIIFDKNAIIYHKGSATWKKFDYKKIYLCRRNSLLTIIKNYEFKNMIRIFFPFLIYSFMFSIGQMTNLRYKNGKITKINEQKSSLFVRFNYALTSPLSIGWNILNLRKTLKKRKEIQKKRTIKDKMIFEKFFKFKNSIVNLTNL